MKIMRLITSVLPHRQAHLNCLSGETPWEIASHWDCWIRISLLGPEGMKRGEGLHACLQGAWSPEWWSQTLPGGNLDLCSGSLGSGLGWGLAEPDTSRPLGMKHLWLVGGVLRLSCRKVFSKGVLRESLSALQWLPPSGEPPVLQCDSRNPSWGTSASWDTLTLFRSRTEVPSS